MALYRFTVTGDERKLRNDYPKIYQSWTYSANDCLNNTLTNTSIAAGSPPTSTSHAAAAPDAASAPDATAAATATAAAAAAVKVDQEAQPAVANAAKNVGTAEAGLDNAQKNFAKAQADFAAAATDDATKAAQAKLDAATAAMNAAQITRDAAVFAKARAERYAAATTKAAKAAATASIAPPILTLTSPYSHCVISITVTGGPAMTEGSHTHSKMMIDDYYMQEPASVICQKTENSRLYE